LAIDTKIFLLEFLRLSTRGSSAILHCLSLLISFSVSIFHSSRQFFSFSPFSESTIPLVDVLYDASYSSNCGEGFWPKAGQVSLLAKCIRLVVSTGVDSFLGVRYSRRGYCYSKYIDGCFRDILGFLLFCTSCMVCYEYIV
jgi:hypothetical protein